MQTKRLWIQKALKDHREGSLHRVLGVSVNEKIPPGKLIEAIKHPERFVSTPRARLRLQRMARLAMTLRGFRKRRRRR